MKKNKRIEVKNIQEFRAFLSTLPPEQARTSFRRRCAPSFVTLIEALANEPEKRRLIREAIERFQRMGADAEGCRQLDKPEHMTFELDAGQGVRFVTVLYPFVDPENFGGILFAEGN